MSQQQQLSEDALALQRACFRGVPVDQWPEHLKQTLPQAPEPFVLPLGALLKDLSVDERTQLSKDQWREVRENEEIAARLTQERDRKRSARETAASEAEQRYSMTEREKAIRRRL